MKKFASLLHREWMQHQRGWVILVALPLVLVILAATFGHVQVNLGDDVAARGHSPEPAALAALSIAGLGAGTLLLAWGSTLLQVPGLARRDVQDRSIEFWLSMPTSHVQSLGATLLAHLLLVPWAALAIGLVGGLVVSALVVAQVHGLAAWFALPWGSIVIGAVALWLRLGLGVLLTTLWLSPLIVGVMAASAWLKRWGLPVFIGGLALGNLVLEQLYGVRALSAALRGMFTSARRAFIGAGSGGSLHINSSAELDAMLPQAAHWLLGDAGRALQAAASPAFMAALAVGAAAFALLVLRRQRSNQ